MNYIFLAKGKAKDVFKEWRMFFLWGRIIEPLKSEDFSVN